MKGQIGQELIYLITSTPVLLLMAQVQSYVDQRKKNWQRCWAQGENEMTKLELIEAIKDFPDNALVVMEVLAQEPGTIISHVDYLTCKMTSDEQTPLIILREFIG